MWLFNWWSSVENLCFESKNIDNTDATSSDATSTTKILADDSGCISASCLMYFVKHN